MENQQIKDLISVSNEILYAINELWKKHELLVEQIKDIIQDIENDAEYIMMENYAYKNLERG